MHTIEQTTNAGSACKQSFSMYSISTADRNRAALYSDVTDQLHVPLSVILNAVRYKARFC